MSPERPTGPTERLVAGVAAERRALETQRGGAAGGGRSAGRFTRDADASVAGGRLAQAAAVELARRSEPRREEHPGPEDRAGSTVVPQPAALSPLCRPTVAPGPAVAVRERSIAVALHDVEPATYERCALIRDWLGDHGIDKVTLLVIPASDLHPFQDRRPEMVDWLADCLAAGDSVAQHGFQHRQARRSASPARQAYARWQCGDAAEFVGLDDAETKRAVDAGRRVLRLAGIQPRGFVAPAYAYTGALRRVLASSFEWWAGLNTLAFDHGRRTTRAQALTLGTSASGFKRLASPAAVRAGAALAGPLLRLDLHPADLDHPSRIGAVEAVLRRARDRTALTYDELAAPS